jgi:hypothetical protein
MIAHFRLQFGATAVIDVYVLMFACEQAGWRE